jgi:hypothetical protein
MNQPSQPQPLKSARVRLGEVIRFQADRRGWTPRKLADICSVPREAIENWFAGRTVPDSRAWESLKHVSHSLASYSQLRQQALLEEEAERNRVIEQREKERQVAQEQRDKSRQAVTNIGDKLAPVISIVKEQEQMPTDPPKPRKPMPIRPPGANSSQAVHERIEFARGLLMTRPYMKINGPDGLVESIKTRFGVGVDPRTLSPLVEEARARAVAGVSDNRVAREAARQAIAQPIEDPMPHQKAVPVAPARDASSEIAAAVKMIIEAVPGLVILTIKVEDDGVIRVAHQVKETRVVVDTGTMELKR